MSKYLGPKLRLSKREGSDLFLKSLIRNIDTKCKIDRLPGQHGHKKTRLSDYGLQLREKQKVKRIYGVLEKQFLNYYKKALKMKGDTGVILLQLLERRLDNIVYRMGFGCTRAESRQLVNHKLIMVNNRIINIPSYLLSINDVIRVIPKAQVYDKIKYSLELFKQSESSSWLEVNITKMEGIFKNIPERKFLSADINEHLVVELYSR